MSFDLRRSPFAELGVSPRSSRDEINRAFRGRQLDMDTPDQERSLEIARQAMFSPRERLDAELAYLLELPDHDAKAILAELGGRHAAVPATISGLAAINLAAHCCEAVISAKSGRSIWPEPATDLIGAYGDLDVSKLRRAVDAARQSSGFGAVSDTDLDNGLARLRAKHVSLLLAGPIETTASTLELLAREAGDGSVERRRLLSDLFHAYALEIADKVEGLAAQVETILDELRAGQTASSRVTALRALLNEWLSFVRPLQERDAQYGLDDPSSLKLLQQIRKTTLELNRANRDDEALEISTAALGVCERMPQFSELLRTDNAALQEIVERRSVAPRLAQLRVAIAQSRARMTKHRNGYAPAKAFTAVFAALTAVAEANPGPDVVAQAVAEARNHAVDLYNDLNNPDAALVITKFLEGIAASATAEAQETIRTDLETFWRARNWKLLGEALQARRWTDAEKLSDALIVKASGEEYRNLANLQRSIAEKRQTSSRRTKAAIWGAMIGVPILLVMANSSHSVSTASDYATVETETEAPYAEQSEPEFDTVETLLEETVDDSGEAMPTAGGGERSLSRQELRYCMMQGKRLDGAREAVSGYAQQSVFNGLINDYNSLCGQFRYDQSDMSAVNLEVMAQDYRLREEGRALIRQGAPVAPPITTSPGADAYEGADSNGSSSATSENDEYADTGYQGNGY